jgi:hypothetical protein
MIASYHRVPLKTQWVGGLEEGVEKNNMSLIDKTPSSSQKIKSGTLRTSKARFLEAPHKERAIPR